MKLILNIENDKKLQVLKALKVKMSVKKKESKCPSERLLDIMKEIRKGTKVCVIITPIK